MTGFAQTDTLPKQTTDTIKIGGMVIIREPGGNYDSTRNVTKYSVSAAVEAVISLPTSALTGGYLISGFLIM